MKWITREHPRVDRVACPWLVERFIDQQAEFLYVPSADKTITPESSGIEAILDGLRQLHHPDDQKQREASRPVMDALYAYCQAKTSKAA